MTVVTKMWKTQVNIKKEAKKYINTLFLSLNEYKNAPKGKCN